MGQRKRRILGARRRKGRENNLHLTIMCHTRRKQKRVVDLSVIRKGDMGGLERQGRRLNKAGKMVITTNDKGEFL